MIQSTSCHSHHIHWSSSHYRHDVVMPSSSYSSRHAFVVIPSPGCGRSSSISILQLRDLSLVIPSSCRHNVLVVPSACRCRLTIVIISGLYSHCRHAVVITAPWSIHQCHSSFCRHSVVTMQASWLRRRPIDVIMHPFSYLQCHAVLVVPLPSSSGCHHTVVIRPSSS